MIGTTSDDFLSVVKAREDQLRQSIRIFDLAVDPSDSVRINEHEILRRLFHSEIQVLRGVCRCICKDFSKIRLLVPKEEAILDRSSELQSLVSDTAFDGVVVFDFSEDFSKLDDKRSTVSDWKLLPPGIHSNLMICDCLFKIKSCRVYRNSLVSKTYVGFESVLLNCGYVSASAVDYGSLTISVGAESGGGRQLYLKAENTMIDVCRQLRGSDTKFPASNHVELNILSHSCLIRDTATVMSIYLHEQASIQAATSVTKATLLPNSSIGNSCTVKNVLLQWDASIMDHSTITDALLMEQGHCGPNSIVASTVIGPDVHTSAGEIHVSVIGPNTNSHHQSLVIGVLWPMGRGNVGYGANVGSNHTGRLPDQETASGEGTFWGLSCVVKFPVDLTFSPYSIVAAGTTLTPQRVCMPFSLIVGQPSGNDIIPGWVLQSSPYTLARSEKKFATRRKAKRHDFYTGWKIFRPEIIEMCRWARNALLEATGGSKVQGVGANKLSDRARESGIRAYNECIQRYVLHGLLSWILENRSFDENVIHYELLGKKSRRLPSQDPSLTVEWPVFPWDTNRQEEWDYQRSLLLDEFPVNSNISAWLEKLLKMLVILEFDFTRRIHRSKSRDDSRGAQTIPGYQESHVPADKDPVIIESRREAEKIEQLVSEVLKKTSLHTRSRL